MSIPYKPKSIQHFYSGGNGSGNESPGAATTSEESVGPTPPIDSQTDNLSGILIVVGIVIAGLVFKVLRNK